MRNPRRRGATDLELGAELRSNNKQTVDLDDAPIMDAFLRWLAWLQDRDIEGTALSFVACQVTLAIAATAGAWAAGSDAACMLFLPAVLLAAFFLRFVEMCFVLLIAFVSTWYFLVPQHGSFALSPLGLIELGTFVLASLGLVAATARLRLLLKRRLTLAARALGRKADVVMEN